MYWLEFAIVAGTAFLTALLLTPLAHRLGVRWGLVAIPDHRRHHQGAIPVTGGFALFVAFTLAIVVAQFLPVERTDSNEIIRFTGLLIGGTVIYAIGFVDDKYDLPALWLYIGQITTASIAILFLSKVSITR